MQIKQYRFNGFTLIEILVALMIFAIIGVMVSIGLHNTILSNQHVKEADTRFQKLQIAQQLMRSDIQYIIPRPIRDKDNNVIQAVTLNNNRLEFTRGGINNPFNPYRQSNLERIAYEVKNKQLIRYTWPILDRAFATNPTSTVILSDITNFNINVFDKNNNAQSGWPLKAGTSKYASNLTHELPRGVRITFKIANEGMVINTIAILSQGLPTQFAGKDNNESKS